MSKKIEIAALPELDTSVAMQGSLQQKEVGGPLCLAVVVGVIAGVPWEEIL